MGIKVCRECLKEKPESEFYKSKNGYLFPYCKVCDQKKSKKSYRENKQARKASIRRTRLRGYGLTEESKYRLLADQGGVCAVCGSSDWGKTGAPVVDHVHGIKPVVVRGLLCSRCNIGIGMLRDDVRILRSAVTYLSRFED